MKLFEQIHDWAGEKINGTSFNIDIVNYCVCECPSCALGSIGVKRKGIMSFDLFRRILDKAQKETKIRHAQLYMYSDPCLHPELDKFVAECTKRGVPTWLSTMAQTTKCDWEKLIEARPTELRISFPGWKKMTYYQKNAKPEIFDKNVEMICSLPRYKETTWTLIWHSYNDNADEEYRARGLAKEKNLKFVRLPSIYMPLERYVENNYSQQDLELISHLWESPWDAAKTMKRSKICSLWKQISIDANGDVFLCQLVFEERFKLMKFLDYPIEDIRRAIKTHSFCGLCLSSGGNLLQNCYSEMAGSTDPIGEANKKRRLK